MIRPELKGYLDKLEQNTNPNRTFEIGQKIGGILGAKDVPIQDKEELAEYLAFQFMPTYDGVGRWGTYYGPVFISTNPDTGETYESPSIEKVDSDVLSYWEKRSAEAQNPILQNRYADLVFDLAPVIQKKKIDYKLGQKVIDSCLEICEKKLCDALESKTRLKRTLVIAGKILNDSERLEKLKHSIIKTEDYFAEDDKPGLWGYAFDWLVIEKKIPLTEKEVDLLVEKMEQRLDRVIDSNPWITENAVKPLAEYYASQNLEEKLKSVLEKWEASCRKHEYSNSDGLVVINYLENLLGEYSKYSKFKFAAEAQKRITQEISLIGEKTKFNTQEISTQITIENEKFEKIINEIFGPLPPKPNIELVITKSVIVFLPDKGKTEEQLKNISKEHPFIYLVSHMINSEEGFPVAKFGSINDSYNYNYHLLKHFSESVHFQAPFLLKTFDKFLEVFSPTETYEALIKSPLFKETDKDFVIRALNALWDKDYVVFSSLAIPLIEDSIRNLFKISAVNYIGRNEDGGYDVLSLGSLLEKGVIKIAFGKIGENLEFYLKVVLTERVGWNLRNNFAHGINKSSLFRKDISFRLLHIIFSLAILRKNKNGSSEN